MLNSYSQVDSQKPIEFAVAMESFEHCHGCVVSPEKVGLPLSLIVEDSTHNRPLRLSVTTEMLGGTALKVIRVVERMKQKYIYC